MRYGFDYITSGSYAGDWNEVYFPVDTTVTLTTSKGDDVTTTFTEGTSIVGAYVGINISSGAVIAYRRSDTAKASAFTGLLDSYSATAAYSLRKLKNDYSGPAIKVRRASDNEEQDIYFIDNDLDTASLTSFCTGTNGFVTTWYDQAGSNDATQATAGSQPKIYDSSTGVVLENGKPAVDFDGSSILPISDFNYNVNSQTILTVSNYTSNASFGYLFAHFDTLSNQRAFFLGKTDTNVLRYGISGDGTFSDVYYADSTETISGGQKLISVIFDGSATFDIQSNGIALTENYAGTPITSIFNSSSNLLIGGFYVSGSPTNLFYGSCQEIILYDSNQSSNREAIEANINSHYNIYS